MNSEDRFCAWFLIVVAVWLLLSIAPAFFDGRVQAVTAPVAAER